MLKTTMIIVYVHCSIHCVLCNIIYLNSKNCHTIYNYYYMNNKGVYTCTYRDGSAHLKVVCYRYTNQDL